MNLRRAIEIARNGVKATEAEYYEAYQHLVDTGLAWRLEGSIGREAVRLLQIDKIKINSDHEDKN